MKIPSVRFGGGRRESGVEESPHMEQAMTAPELLRLPSPAPAPQALAFDGEHLWLGSWETQRLYGIDPHHFTVFEEANAPGKPVGAVCVGDELRLVCSEGSEGDRFIRRFIPGHGFKEHDRISCPEHTGSFLAFDGTHLWLSQRYNKRVFKLDAEYRVTAAVEIGAEVLGVAWVEGALYASTWHGKEGGCAIVRVADIDTGLIDTVASMPFAAISLTHDGSRFWTNDPRTTSLVAFNL